jgi:hypothetical protein
VCCVRGVQINNNNFGIKVVTWMEHDSPRQNFKETSDGECFFFKLTTALLKILFYRFGLF